MRKLTNVVDSRSAVEDSKSIDIFSADFALNFLLLQEGLIEEGTPAAAGLSKGDLMKRKQYVKIHSFWNVWFKAPIARGSLLINDTLAFGV